MEDKITVGFRFVDEYGQESKAESTFMPDDTTLGEMFNEFRHFLQYCGFEGFEKENLLPESLTDEELDYLLKCLAAYREGKEEEEFEENYSENAKSFFSDFEGIVIYVENTDTFLHIRKGSGSYLTDEDRATGYVDYAKITEYLSDFSISRTEVKLLDTPFRESEISFLIGECVREIYPDIGNFHWKIININ